MVAVMIVQEQQDQPQVVQVWELAVDTHLIIKEKIVEAALVLNQMIQTLVIIHNGKDSTIIN
jgi:hypothetical protein